MKRWSVFDLDREIEKYNKAKERDPLTLMSLRLFVVCRHKGSRTAAAAALGVSKAVISCWLQGKGSRLVNARTQVRLVARGVNPFSILEYWEKAHPQSHTTSAREGLDIPTESSETFGDLV